MEIQWNEMNIWPSIHFLTHSVHIKLHVFELLVKAEYPGKSCKFNTRNAFISVGTWELIAARQQRDLPGCYICSFKVSTCLYMCFCVRAPIRRAGCSTQPWSQNVDKCIYSVSFY